MQQLTQLTTTPLGGTGPEIGFRRPDQVDAILDAGRLELSDADVAGIEDTKRPAKTR
jgi:aryl-alcohol dehydrogenase-like predicted oxidoreductase